jgi:DNA-binding helix-hairpin-helix protein with protein kinase domain
MTIGTGSVVNTTDAKSFVLGELIGQGGQAAVYAVHGDDTHCVKVYKGLSEAARVRTRDRLARLRRLSPTQSLVLPESVLEVPLVGYVMRRVTDAQPLSYWAVAPNTDMTAWFASTGGLRRRLQIGVALARAFKELHARGLAYCDVSFDNVLVSPRGNVQLSLIDCDNLTVDGAAPPSVQGTPWFIASEVLTGAQRPDAFTDAWSLAVVLYHLLVLTHPMLGDDVRNASPAIEEKALMGFREDGSVLPWVDDADDASNRSQHGLPRERVVSPGLQELFARAFGPGLHDRLERPVEGQWIQALTRALDATLMCVSCRNHHYLSVQADGQRGCQWCPNDNAKVPRLDVLDAAGRRPVTVERVRYLFASHLTYGTGSVGDAPLLMVTRLGDERLQVESVTGDAFVVGSDGSVGTRRKAKVILGNGDWVSLSEKSPQAVAVLP